MGFLPASLEQSLRHWLFKSINQRKLGGGRLSMASPLYFFEEKGKGEGGEGAHPPLVVVVTRFHRFGLCVLFSL